MKSHNDFNTMGIETLELEKLEKKRMIREKAARLLNKVKSQEYLVNRGNLM